MTKNLVFLTIHGMGETEKEYYQSLKQSLEKPLGKDIWDKVHFEPIYYQLIHQLLWQTPIKHRHRQLVVAVLASPEDIFLTFAEIWMCWRSC